MQEAGRVQLRGPGVFGWRNKGNEGESFPPPSQGLEVQMVTSKYPALRPQ